MIKNFAVTADRTLRFGPFPLGTFVDSVWLNMSQTLNDVTVDLGFTSSRTTTGTSAGEPLTEGVVTITNVAGRPYIRIPIGERVKGDSRRFLLCILTGFIGMCSVVTRDE